MLQITNRDLEFYNKALALSRSHESHGRYSLTCIAAKHGNMIGIGFNSYAIRRGGETLSSAYAGYGVHAELDCLYKWNVRRCTLYIAGCASITKNAINSTPCDKCQNLIDNCTARFIVYYNGVNIVKTKKDPLRM